MDANDAIKKHKCEFCNYKTNRSFDLKRHQNAKHKCQIIENINNNLTGENVTPSGENVTPNCENVTPNCENVTPNCENVTPSGENVTPNEKIVTPSEQNICKKCNKIYNSKRYLIEHEKKCKGVDELTCPKCMISFTNRHHKSRHIKNNNCKAKSIIHARIPNPQNIETLNKNINTQNNITNNNIENQTNNNIETQNNIVINNYGNERLDYVTYDKMLEMFKKFYNSPSLLTKEIHFNKDFPENNNIKYENKNQVIVKADDELVLKDLNSLAKELVDKKANKVHEFAQDNKEDICKDMKLELEQYQEICNLLFTYAILQQPKDEYRKQIYKVKELILNTKQTKLSTYSKRK